MVAAASPITSVNGNDARAGTKRKADDDDGSPEVQTHTRSKRSRYISIACNECKRRKIKCNGQTPCQRCGNLSLDCVYAPNCCTNSVKDSQEFKQMQDQVANLENQIADLYNIVNELRSSHVQQPSEPMYTPLEDRRSSTSAARTLPPILEPKKPIPRRQLPRFHGPTSSIYGFDVAKSSLSNMGITQPPDTDGMVSRERSQAASPVYLAPHPSKDPIWSLDQAEAIRLVNVYDEECHIMYPVLDLERLFKHIHALYTFIAAALRAGLGQPGLPGEDALDDEMTTQLKLVLACALTIEGHGQSELGQKLYDSAKKAVDLVIVGPLSLKAAVLIILTATYHFQKDEETQAWRFIGIAGRQCIEMGLHQRSSLLRSFPNYGTDQTELNHAVRVFWVIYALDRRWSFGTGMPFSLQDADIDPLLPVPDDIYPYLKHITVYNRIGTKIWQHIANFETGNPGIRPDDIGYLDFQIMKWYSDLPDMLQFDSSNLEMENQIPGRKTRRLRFLMFLRKNQARISVYRPILHSVTSIMENRQNADTVIDIAKDTIKTIIGIDRISDIYQTQQVCYNYFLVQALAVIFLSVAHAPALFCDKTREEFYGAIDLIKGFSTKSHTTRRLWKTIRGLKELGNKIGQLARGEAATPHRLENDAHSDAAIVMASLGGHNVDQYQRPPSHGHSVDTYSPEDASQMGNELTALFEMAGAYGNNNGMSNASIEPFAGYVPDGDGEFNAMFGNEPEFSRIMNELL